MRLIIICKSPINNELSLLIKTFNLFYLSLLGHKRIQDFEGERGGGMKMLFAGRFVSASESFRPQGGGGGGWE